MASIVCIFRAVYVRITLFRFRTVFCYDAGFNALSFVRGTIKWQFGLMLLLGLLHFFLPKCEVIGLSTFLPLFTALIPTFLIFSSPKKNVPIFCFRLYQIMIRSALIHECLSLICLSCFSFHLSLFFTYQGFKIC
jgi:hypothetical protein